MQRIVNARSEITTKELTQAIQSELGLGRSQAEGLITSAREASLIERRRRELYGRTRELSGLMSTTATVSIPF
jgi:hypothetical protein